MLSSAVALPCCCDTASLLPGLHDILSDRSSLLGRSPILTIRERKRYVY